MPLSMSAGACSIKSPSLCSSDMVRRAGKIRVVAKLVFNRVQTALLEGQKGAKGPGFSCLMMASSWPVTASFLRA